MHTINIYRLDAIDDFVVQKLNARELLNYKRFDLFAKLYYIQNRHNNSEDANNVYVQHIIAFNPDLKEPGRDDKKGIDTFINTFNNLIDTFKHSDFDDNISLIPVDEKGVILDGAHRVAALAYYNKDVTVIKFNGIRAKCDFDYTYFMKRGLSWAICDKILLESLNWIDNVYCALLWPRIKSSNVGIRHITNIYDCIVERRFDINYKALRKISHEIFKNRNLTRLDSDVNNKTSWFICGRKVLHVVLFQTNDAFGDIISLKNKFCEIYGLGMYSFHITDSINETIEIVSLFFTPEGKTLWQSSLLNKEIIKEKLFRVKTIHLLKLKITIFSFLSKVKNNFMK